MFCVEMENEKYECTESGFKWLFSDVDQENKLTSRKSTSSTFSYRLLGG